MFNWSFCNIQIKCYNKNTWSYKAFLLHKVMAFQWNLKTLQEKALFQEINNTIFINYFLLDIIFVVYSLHSTSRKWNGK